MKPTRSQLDALLEQLEGAEVGEQLDIHVTLAPARAGDGTLYVRAADRWGIDHLHITRQGLATYVKPSEATP